ncbi:hypothetical protein [Actinomadura sp. 9N407]|uniref:hypothetical protein n=1 Tax=Actinomadura sp. 9N407 TaxID=3375154 RepID=UPI0037A1AF56
MTPGTLVLLHAPHGRSSDWGDLPEALRTAGPDVIAPDVPAEAGMRYVARASLEIAAAVPSEPLVLVAHGGAGPLLPAIALAQRAAHRKISGYVFIDAAFPRTAGLHDHAAPEVAVPPDWPEAPCGYLRTSAAEPAEAADRSVREARLRGWPVIEQELSAPVLAEIIALL